MTLSPFLPITAALVGLGTALFYYFADTQGAKVLSRDMFLLFCLIATFAASVENNNPSWMVALLLGQVWVLFFFVVFDVLLPVFDMLRRFLTRSKQPNRAIRVP